MIFNEEAVARILRRARNTADVSQQHVADKMKVSKKTVQNWEEGTSSPTVPRFVEYFKAIGLQPMPFILELLYNEYEGIAPSSTDSEIELALFTLMKDLPISAKRKILYCAYGDHGSSPASVLELITARLKTPLRDRLNVANTVRMNYHIAMENSTLIGGEHIRPDTELLDKALQEAYKSVTKGKAQYTVSAYDD